MNLLSRVSRLFALVVATQACACGGDDTMPICATGASCGPGADASVDGFDVSVNGLDANVVDASNDAPEASLDASTMEDSAEPTPIRDTAAGEPSLVDVAADARPAPGPNGVLQYHKNPSR